MTVKIGVHFIRYVVIIILKVLISLKSNVRNSDSITAWMNPENIMLGEMSQIQMDEYCLTSVI